MSQDQEQLNLLSIFHYIVGALTILFSCIFLIYVGMGIGMVVGAFDEKDPPPAFLGWVFIAVGAAIMLIGWTLGILTIVAGKKLRARTSRTFCIVIAAIQCLNQPFGLALGIFTIIVLTRDSVTRLFAANEQASPVEPPLPT